MTENRIKTYERLLVYILILAVILGIVSQLTGCGQRTIQDEKDSYNTYFVRISSECGGDIVYDSRTGVQYWRSDGAYNYGTLTMLMDTDGKPLIYKEEK